ncbi:hypothetical protein RDI58_022348 [Solanum bulbocastanum]|uniref:Uncharacterized protein n=1 Tax=Solanum bulbocastanum TaxID=147425 RepID=A0AAN8T2I1_SOLBU
MKLDFQNVLTEFLREVKGFLKSIPKGGNTWSKKWYTSTT